MREILSFCEAEQAWLLETIRMLVAAESPTDDKAAVDACGRVLATRLETTGGRVTRIRQAACGDQLRVEWSLGDAGPPEEPATVAPAPDRQILLLGHFDTVWGLGQLESMPLREEDGRLHGPGVLDMKGGIALGIQAVRALEATRATNGARVVMLLTTDEESGGARSRALIEEEARRSAAVLVLEPALPGGALKTSRKGCGQYELVVRGKAAHAGVDPRGGVSAIAEIARQIVRLESLQDLERGITVTVGLISGGTRPNVVPERAAVTIDVRVPSVADAERVDAALRALTPALPGASLEVRGSIDHPPLERTAAVVRLYETARQIAAELGHELGEGGTGGGSDGNFTASLGIPTLDGLGATGDGAHARHEHVIVADLAWRAALVAGLIHRLSSSS